MIGRSKQFDAIARALAQAPGGGCGNPAPQPSALARAMLEGYGVFPPEQGNALARAAQTYGVFPPQQNALAQLFSAVHRTSLFTSPPTSVRLPAMSVADNFRAFRANYLIPSTTMSDISRRYRRLTRQLNTDFWETTSETAHSLYVGSYGRDTAANGVSDVDMIFSLPWSVYTKYNGYTYNGQSALLQAVRTSIANTYPSTYVGGDGQVVVVSFSDGMVFEVLPAFEHGAGFTFPDSNSGGSWRNCDPRAEMSAFSARNRVTANGNLKALARMARVWRDYHGVGLSGMLIDTLAYEFIATWEYRQNSYMYHDWMMRDFFFYLSQIPTTRTRWNAPGSNAHVHRTGYFYKASSDAYQLALSAINHEANARPATARNKWREIFGPTYP